MRWPDVFVGACAVAVVIWILLFSGCRSSLPAEPAYVETVTRTADASRR